MLSCKAKLNELVLFEGVVNHVKSIEGNWLSLVNSSGDTTTVENDCLKINGRKHVSGRACDFAIPF